MFDRRALKSHAKKSLRGTQPSAYLIASCYVAAFGVFSALAYALTGLDRYLAYVKRVVVVDPFITASILLKMLPRVSAVSAALFFIVLIARFLVNAGFQSWCLKTSRGEPSGFQTLFGGAALYWKLVRLQVMRTGLIVLGSLLVVPGVRVYYSLRQAVYIQLDNPTARPIDCLRASHRMMRGHKAELFWLDVTFLGWLAIDVLVRLIATLRLFSIWLGPYLGVTRASFYDALNVRDAFMNRDN